MGRLWNRFAVTQPQRIGGDFRFSAIGGLFGDDPLAQFSTLSLRARGPPKARAEGGPDLMDDRISFLTERSAIRPRRHSPLIRGAPTGCKATSLENGVRAVGKNICYARGFLLSRGKGDRGCSFIIPDFATVGGGGAASRLRRWRMRREGWQGRPAPGWKLSRRAGRLPGRRVCWRRGLGWRRWRW